MEQDKYLEFHGEVYSAICRNNVTSELAAWLAGMAVDYRVLRDRITELEKQIKRLTCKTCKGTGVERSGVCHCGVSMDDDGLFAHDGHCAVEMTRACVDCSNL